jgi:hypothetical protein
MTLSRSPRKDCCLLYVRTRQRLPYEVQQYGGNALQVISLLAAHVAQQRPSAQQRACFQHQQQGRLLLRQLPTTSGWIAPCFSCNSCPCRDSRYTLIQSKSTFKFFCKQKLSNFEWKFQFDMACIPTKYTAGIPTGLRGCGTENVKCSHVWNGLQLWRVGTLLILQLIVFF